jgi:hypothetical protein
VVELTTFQASGTTDRKGSRRTPPPSGASSEDGSHNGSQSDDVELQGGELQESYNRFTEVSNSGGGSSSCWAIASWEQLSEETRRRRGWRSVADVRETVAASIEGGTRRQRHSRLEYLRYT